jgi:regulator of protease activity HflC (stomatin/prohibitin superfamily)
MDPVVLVLVPIVALAAILLISSLFTVSQQTTAVDRAARKIRRASRTAGLNFKLPLIERVGTRVNLRVQQLDVRVETKTEDNVFVHVMVSGADLRDPREGGRRVLQARPTRAADQRSFVFDVVRARVPQASSSTTLFANKDEIADAVKHELTEAMDDFGYGIVKALVTDIDPDAQREAAMNEINAAQRDRVAAMERGEADRILRVKAAEAEAQSKALQGKGTADQRRAIVDGLRDSVDAFSRGIPGATPQDVLALIIATQYFDTLRDIVPARAAQHDHAPALARAPRAT